MKIRTANISDVPKTALLFDAYRVFYEKESDVPAAATFLSERINKNESVIYIAETEGGDLAGFVQLYPIFSSTRMKRLWLLNDLYVKSEYRGRHISIALLDQAKALARETMSAGLILETAKSNMIGNQLYPATGFELDEDHNYYSWSY